MEKQQIDFTDSILAAQEGHMEAFDFLYRKSITSLSKKAMLMLHGQRDYEDVLQNTYLKIFKELHTLKDPNKFLSWSLTVCERECLDFLRKKKKETERMQLLPNTSEEEEFGLDQLQIDIVTRDYNPEAVMDAQETKRLLDVMLEDLPENHRTAILLWKENLSTKEIADAMDIPLGTAKTYVNRAKKAIEGKVLALEKQGTKIYSMAPFTFFLWVLEQYEANYTPTFSREFTFSLLQKIIENLPEECFSTPITTDSVDKFATKITSHSSSFFKPKPKFVITALTQTSITKIISIMLVLTTISTGGVFYYKHTHNSNDTQEIQEVENNSLEKETSNMSSEWKQAYIDYIERKLQENNLPEDRGVTYKLVNINNDNIPELYIDWGYTYLGSVICSYSNDSIAEQIMYVGGFSYIESQNLFCDSGGHMDNYYDNIYYIDNGEFILQCSGNYGASDNSNVQYDSDDNPIYKYNWNGTKVSSKSEYIKELNKVYDTKKAKYPIADAEYDMNAGRYVGNGLCNYEEILEEIKNY